MTHQLLNEQSVNLQNLNWSKQLSKSNSIYCGYTKQDEDSHKSESEKNTNKIKLSKKQE